MSTWSSNPYLLAALLMGAAFVLSACTAGSDVNRAVGLRAAGLTRLPVLDEAVVIAAPRGFCIDTGGSRADSYEAFVLLASCRAVSGDPDAPHPKVPGLLTASVDGATMGATLPGVAQMQAYFNSAPGRAALSASGDPAAVSVERSYARDGVFFVHAREAGVDGPTGGQSWRSVFLVNGRVVSATLRDLERQPISADAGFRIVERFTALIRSASPDMQ